MKLIIIRHGESEADLLNVHEGRADFSLTDLGIHQAEHMAEWMKQHFTIDKIYSSTLIRAKQTAEILQRKVDCELLYKAELMEWNNGLIAGLSFEEAAIQYPKKMNLPLHACVYGQESLLDFRFRAEQILSQIISENEADSTIAIVSHGKMIRELYMAFLEFPVQSNVYLHTGDTGIHYWAIQENQKHVVWANRMEHLLGLEEWN